MPGVVPPVHAEDKDHLRKLVFLFFLCLPCLLTAPLCAAAPEDAGGHEPVPGLSPAPTLALSAGPGVAPAQGPFHALPPQGHVTKPTHMHAQTGHAVKTLTTVENSNCSPRKENC